MAEFIQGNNRISVDIVDRAENRIGPGPIGTCLGVDYTAVLNDAGEFTARFPANDPLVNRLQLKKHFLDIYVDGELLCWGLAEKWDWALDNDGQQILIVTGRESLAELDETTIDFTTVDDNGDPVFNAPSLVLTAYNSKEALTYQWILNGETETATGVYTKFAGESALSALRRIAEETGESFRMGVARRTITWLGADTTASGVRAEGGTGDALDAENNQYICFIQSLTERRDASKMLTKIFPFGSGLGETRLDPEGTTRVAPAGFTYNTAEKSIASDAALVYVGKGIERHVNFKNIRPLFNTDADILSAKNYLFDAALAYLQRNDDVDDTLEYDLSVLQLPSQVEVGMTLRVIWQDAQRDINTDLVLLGIRTTVGSNGERTYLLKVATHNQWRFRETSNIDAQIEEGEIFLGHPQIDATAYWMPFREMVGDDQTDHMAEFPFWLSAEIVTIRQVLFRFSVGRVLSIVANVAYASADTGASGTGATSSVAPGSTDANSVGVTGDSPAGTTDSGGSSTTGATASGATDNNSVGVTGDSPAGATDTSGSGTSGDTAAGLTGDNSVVGDPHQHTISATHLHTTPAHSHIVTTNHSHSTPAHSHITTGTHIHTTPAHTHVVTANHSHTTPAHVHAHTATHSHTGPSHVHTAPALQTTYNMQLLPALTSYVIGDLEFSVNGGSWVALDTAIPVAGGYSEVDITSEIQNPNGLKRPNVEYNIVQVRRTAAAGTGKTAQLRAQIGIRATVQSIVVYE